MSGGLSFLLVKSPEASKANSPVNSDAEDEDVTMDAVEYDDHTIDVNTITESAIGKTPLMTIENNNEESVEVGNRIKLEKMMDKSIELMESQQLHQQQPLIKLSPLATRKTTPLVTVKPYRTRSRMANRERISVD